MASREIPSAWRRRQQLGNSVGIVVGTIWLAAAVGATPGAFGAEGSHFDVVRDLVYAERDSGPLKADLYVPKGDGPFPAMLVIHGGAWAHGTKEQLRGAATTLAEAGYTAATISYRLAPQHRFPAQIHDCQAAVRWLRSHAAELKVDPDRIGGYGYSAGGHLVAMLGALDDDDLREPGLPADVPSARLQAVVAGGAPCDFRMLADDSQRLAYWLGGTPAETPDMYRNASPNHYVTADDPPMFFFHGTDDELVSIGSPRRMFRRLKEVGVAAEIHEVAGASHMFAAIDREALGRALAFVDRYLKAGASTVDEYSPSGRQSHRETTHGE